MMIRRRSFVLAAASVLAIPVSAAEAPLVLDCDISGARP